MGKSRGTVTEIKPAVAPQAHAPGTRKRLMVLVCEQDSQLRETLVKLTRSLGHDVTAASDARTALSTLVSMKVDVLLTELALPDMAGATLAQYAKSRAPALVVLFMSDQPGEAAPDGSAAGMLAKPVTANALAAAIVDAQANSQPDAQPGA